MRAIYKRELRSYFTSMTGYLFIAVVVFFIGIYFMANNLYYGDPGFSTTLVNVMVVLLVAVPVLTMRSMAEERRSRTDQLLLTAPVSVSGVVMGKYLAMVTILAIPMLLSCICPLIIAANGTSQLMSDYASIFAFFLMGCVFVAVGMFISALTESQIIAAVGTFAALLTLYLWDSLMQFLPDALANETTSYVWSRDGEALYSEDSNLEDGVDALAGLAFTSCAYWKPSDDTVTACGLDDTATKITITYEGGSVTLLLGGTDENGYYYAQLEGSQQLNLMYATTPDNLLKLLTAQTQAEADAAAQAEEAESETAEDTSVETDSAAETTDSPAETDSGAE